jgi:hypothetical protein
LGGAPAHGPEKRDRCAQSFKHVRSLANTKPQVHINMPQLGESIAEAKVENLLIQP